MDPLPPAVFPGLTSAAGSVPESPDDHIRRGEERGRAEAVRDSACWRADGDTEQRTVEENEGTGSGVVEEEDATESLPGGQPDHAAPCHSSRGGEWLEQMPVCCESPEEYFIFFCSTTREGLCWHSYRS